VKSVFVDANVFLRFFTKDDTGQHARAAKLFRAGAARQVPLVSGPPVLFEVAWTLRAAYGQSGREILDVLEAILALPGLSLTDATVCAEAVRLARHSGVDFSDAYIVARAKACGAEAVATFNLSDFRKLGVPCHVM
jgi:predicted nucleic acid-binding protein